MSSEIVIETDLKEMTLSFSRRCLPSGNPYWLEYLTLEEAVQLWHDLPGEIEKFKEEKKRQLLQKIEETKKEIAALDTIKLHS